MKRFYIVTVLVFRMEKFFLRPLEFCFFRIIRNKDISHFRSFKRVSKLSSGKFLVTEKWNLYPYFYFFFFSLFDGIFCLFIFVFYYSVWKFTLLTELAAEVSFFFFSWSHQFTRNKNLPVSSLLLSKIIKILRNNIFI